jgi:activator of Hsp90 ATPase-like protein
MQRAPATPRCERNALPTRVDLTPVRRSARVTGAAVGCGGRQKEADRSQHSTPAPGARHEARQGLSRVPRGGCARQLVPGELLRYTDRFEDPNLSGEIRVTVTLRKVALGTDVTIVQEGLPDVIPVEACYLGWQESLRNLSRLVEPEITDGQQA